LKELEVPPEIAANPEARELLRVWYAGEMTCALRTTFKDPAAWGIALVDVIRHVSRAYALDDGSDPAEVQARILQGMAAELESPTSPIQGGVTPKKS
jgi:hypothetical protein